MALVWSQDSRGGYLTTPKLSSDVRYNAQNQQVFTNFVAPAGSDGANLGMNQGDTFQWTSVGDLEDGRILKENEIVPTGNLDIQKQTVKAYEISIGIDYNWRLDILAELDIYDMIIQSLINSMARTLDRMCAAVFRATDLVYTPTGSLSNPSYVLGTAGIPLAGAQRPFVAWDHLNVVNLLGGTYNAPTFYSDAFAVVCSHQFHRGILDDLKFMEATKHQYSERLVKGYVGDYQGGKFHRENNALINDFGSQLGEAIYIGGDAVFEITVMPEELQAKLGADYGRDRGMRWVAYKNWAEAQKFSKQQTPRLMRVAALTPAQVAAMAA